MIRCDALAVSLRSIRELSQPLRRLRTRGADLERQIGVEGDRPTALCEEVDVRGGPSWSPGGESLVVAGAVIGEGSASAGLFVVDAERGSRRRIVDGPSFHPRWSPTSDLIVYAGPQSAAAQPLLAVTSEGEPVTLPAEVGVFGQGHRFLPDGSGLVYLQGSRIVLDFWLLELAPGSQPRRLTRLDGRDAINSRFDVAPDGKSIVFDRHRQRSDGVLIELEPSED